MGAADRAGRGRRAARGQHPDLDGASRPHRLRQTPAPRRTSASRSASSGFVFLIDLFGEGRVDRVGALVIILGALAWSAAPSTRAAPPCRSARSSPPAWARSAAASSCWWSRSPAVASARRPDRPPPRRRLPRRGRQPCGLHRIRLLLRAAPVSLVATYAYVNLITAVAPAGFSLGEAITLQMVVAGAAILIAVALISGASGAAVEPGRGLLRRRGRVPAPPTRRAKRRSEPSA